MQNTNRNENWIVNNDNSITNVNIHVNNFNVNSNTMIPPLQESDSKKDTLQINNLKEAMANIKIDYDSPLSENMRKYTSELANSLGKCNNYILDTDSKDFKDIQEKLIYDPVENYEHFTDSEIKIEFSDIDEINKLSNKYEDNQNNLNNNKENNTGQENTKKYTGKKRKRVLSNIDIDEEMLNNDSSDQSEDYLYGNRKKRDFSLFTYQQEQEQEQLPQ